MTSPRQDLSLTITGMSCISCANRLTKVLNETDGIEKARINFATNKAHITYDHSQITSDHIIDVISKTGFDSVAAEKHTLTLNIDGMHCSTCAQKIKSKLEQTTGVIGATVNIATDKAHITYDPDQTNPDTLQQTIEGLGFTATVDTHPATDAITETAYRMWIATSLSAVIMVLMIIHMFIATIPGYFLITALLALPVVFYAGWNTHAATLNNLKHHAVTMDTLVTLGSVVPYLLSLLGYWFPITTFIEMAATITAFHLIGRFLEAKAKGSTSQAISKLIALEARQARILSNGEEKTVPITDLRPDDIILIKPGEKIPTDGIIINGKSAIDESMATGESLPVKKQPGDEVIGSTINKHGMLTVKATKVGKDTFLSQVIRLVQECQGTKVPIQEFADRITSYFVPVVIIIAVSSFLSWLLFPAFHVSIIKAFDFPWTNPHAPIFTLAFLAATAVLVISCPCALGLATPTALMVGTGLGAEMGIIIRRGEAIQTMRDVKLIAFDKTGTITVGKPEVTNIVITGPYDEPTIISYAASIERASEHPLASAIVDRAMTDNVSTHELSHFTSISGKGVAGKVDAHTIIVGNRKLMDDNNVDYSQFDSELNNLENEAKTTMLIAIDNSLAAIIAVADPIKPEAQTVITQIRQLGIKTAMITGDNSHTAKAIAAQAGISQVVSEVLPDGKVATVKKLQEQYDTIAMVGDGINDAPALTQANIGIALGTGTDIAIEAADITLVRGNLQAVVSAIKLSTATFGKIRQNFFWAWFYNAMAIPAAFFGLLHPMIGAAAMAISSLNVVLNSLRLKKVNI